MARLSSRTVRLNTSRDRLRNQAARQLRAAQRNGRVPLDDALRILAAVIEDALGEGFAAGVLATQDDDAP